MAMGLESVRVKRARGTESPLCVSVYTLWLGGSYLRNGYSSKPPQTNGRVLRGGPGAARLYPFFTLLFFIDLFL